MSTDEKVLARLRRVCLDLPETTETDSWGHPNFRAGKRLFVAFEHINGRPSIAFHLGVNDSETLLLDRANCFATPYGRGQWISLWADRPLDWDLIRTFVEQSYRSVALKRMIAALDSPQRQSRTGIRR